MFQCARAPPDPIFNLSASYERDESPDKINLGVGAYRSDSGEPWILPVVKKVEHMIVSDKSLNHEYLAIDGLKSFTRASAHLMLQEHKDNVASCQTISGTGACRLGAEFLFRFHRAPVYLPTPTWGNHRAIFSDAGFTDIRDYPYWNAQEKSLDFTGLMSAFSAAPEHSIMLIHPCAHNPTGVDPTLEQWKEIGLVCKGFASGDLVRDSAAVRLFCDLGLELLFAQSYAKNFGLYNERCGCLNVVTSSAEKALDVSSQLCKIVRASYSNPPAFGARIVSTILNSRELRAEWSIFLLGSSSSRAWPSASSTCAKPSLTALLLCRHLAHGHTLHRRLACFHSLA